ncbi:hypothetical protein AB1L30_00185, partial [Bremerella sp. JC817]|uniref:hypothetical protein n=1 Tax=Bremerella sp. JC817 TaxID=3231756 RepID=UPI00345B0C89
MSGTNLPRVIITEIDPINALQAAMEGYVNGLSDFHDGISWKEPFNTGKHGRNDFGTDSLDQLLAGSTDSPPSWMLKALAAQQEDDPIAPVQEGIMPATSSPKRCAWAGNDPDMQAYHDQVLLFPLDQLGKFASRDRIVELNPQLRRFPLLAFGRG